MLSEWQPFETAPKDGTRIWLACFAPGADIPIWIAQASYGTAMPSTVRLASYSGWFIDRLLISDLPLYKGGRAYHGIIYEGDYAPTHWMRPIPLRALAEAETPEHDRSVESCD